MVAVGMRKAHLLALMSALPLLVAGPEELEIERRAGRLHPLVDRFFRDMDQMPVNAGIPALFDTVLEAAEAWQELLRAPEPD